MAGARALYRIEDLTRQIEYLFTVSGLDFRHGERNQSLPPASVRRLVAPDRDSDNIADADDNCPIFTSNDNTDSNDDGIGDVCEAEAVVGLTAAADGTRAVNLSWMNPVGSNLVALNISYGRRDGMGAVYGAQYRRGGFLSCWGFRGLSRAGVCQAGRNIPLL